MNDSNTQRRLENLERTFQDCKTDCFSPFIQVPCLARSGQSIPTRRENDWGVSNVIGLAASLGVGLGGPGI